MGLVDKLFGSYSAKELKRIRPQVDAVLALEDHYRQMDNKTLQGETARFKELLANGKNLDDILPEAFAACREAADRVLGMRHFPVQVMGGIILHQGRIIADGTLAELKALFPPATREYVEKQPSLEEIFLAIIGSPNAERTATTATTAITTSTSEAHR